MFFYFFCIFFNSNFMLCIYELFSNFTDYLLKTYSLILI